MKAQDYYNALFRAVGVDLTHPKRGLVISEGLRCFKAKISLEVTAEEIKQLIN